MSDAEALKQLLDGVVTTVVALPGQLKRAWDQPPLRALAVEKVKSLGDSMGYTPYYGGNTQLFKMPPGQRGMGGLMVGGVPGSMALGACCKACAMGEDSTSKALPFIALGIVGIVAWNVLKRK